MTLFSDSNGRLVITHKEFGKFVRHFGIEDNTTATFLANQRHLTCATWGVQPIEKARHTDYASQDDLPIASIWTPDKGSGKKIPLEIHKSNVVTGVCLIGYEESIDDALKRPTLEDVYNLRLLSNLMTRSEGEAVVWFPDNTFKLGLIEWVKGSASSDPNTVDDVTQIYIDFCKKILPLNCHLRRMSDQPALDEIEEGTVCIRDEIDHFYRIPSHAITKKQRTILHKYAATMAALAENIVRIPERDIVVLSNADEKGTAKTAYDMIRFRGRKNRMYLLSPFHIYGIGLDNSNVIGVRNSMFHSSPEYKIFTGDREDVNFAKMESAEGRYPGITGSWRYAAGRAFGTPIKNNKELAELTGSMRAYR